MNYFKKEYKNNKEAIFFYSRYTDIYNKSLSQEYYKIPKPLKVHKNIIFFEKIEGCIYGKNSHYYLGKIDLMYDIGFALGKLHLNLNKKLSLEGECYLHGDFCPGNILIDEKYNIWFVDFEPPSWELEKDRTVGTIYDDLGKFIYSIHSMYPIWMFYTIFFRKKTKELESFILGYSQSTNMKIKKDLLNDKLLEYKAVEKKYIINIDITRHKRIYRIVRYLFLLLIKL